MVATIRQSTFDAIGTKWEIRCSDAMDDAHWQTMLAEVQARIDQFDHTYSRFRDDSLVAEMAAQAGEYAMPPDGLPLLDLYHDLYQLSDGKITPFIGQVMEDAGYDAMYSLQPGTLAQPPRWEDVLAYDNTALHLHKPALLDFGAAGKGYLIDIVANQLTKNGMTEFVVNAGGDIFHHSAGGSTLEVGMENPFDTTEVIGTVGLGNASLCASSGTKRMWRGMHHIIDPHRLQPVDEVVATWVLADSALIADGLATALFFMEPLQLQSRYSFSYARIMNSGGIELSKSFPAHLFEVAS